MNRTRALKIIRRRMDHLEERIETSDKDLTFDRAEYAALTWVIYNLPDVEDDHDCNDC